MSIKILPKNTAGRRQMSVIDYAKLLTKRKPEKKLIKRLQKHAGRNNLGRITVRHRGGGYTTQYRMIDFKQTEKLNIPGTIAAIEYDPNRSGFIALVHYKDGDKRYILAADGVKVGDEVMTAQRTKVKAGNRMMLKNIPVGFNVYNVELLPGSGGKVVRAAGGLAKLLAVEGEYAQIQMPSSEVRLFPKDCFASIGTVSNLDHFNVSIGTAGRKRHMGWRPTVRGKVMNPVDHPHGGGEGRNPIGLKHPKTPWGKPALGVKTRRRKYTNKFIVRNRHGKGTAASTTTA